MGRIIMTNIGFLIPTVGNGHLTQAKTTFQILKKNGINVPIIIACGRNKPHWENLFPNSSLQHEFVWVSEEEVNNINSIRFTFNMLRTVFKPINTEKYIKKYNLDLVITFWTPNIVTSFSVPCISIASQYAVQDIRMNLLIKLFINKQIPISIGKPNKYSP